MGTFGVAEGLVAVGAVAVAVSIFLYWVDLSHNFGGAQITRRLTAKDVPVQVLWDYTTHASNPSLLIVLIPSVALCVAGLLLEHSGWLGALGGVVALVVGLLFVYQAHQELRAEHVPGVGLTDFVGKAPYVCIAGGALALVGGGLAFLRGSART